MRGSPLFRAVLVVVALLALLVLLELLGLELFGILCHRRERGIETAGKTADVRHDCPPSPLVTLGLLLAVNQGLDVLPGQTGSHREQGRLTVCGPCLTVGLHS